MSNKYNFKETEEKFRNEWFSSDIYKADDNSEKPKKYVLVEFPYPSGSGLHMGHAFTFTAGDLYARFNRMRGHNVLFPMGWDAFGLPTENYAIKTKRKPQEVTKENTDSFREEMKRLGLSFDWSREVNTTDPEYYKWTQWIFIKLFEKGLAYKEEMPINWCPSCKTGLANEEVIDGKCERCGTQTEKRNISQWVVKITAYADRLIEGLKDTSFIDKVKAAQINWIDRKDWIDIKFKVDGVDEDLVIATTRPDTIYGVTFIVLAPENELVSKIIRGEIKTDQDIAAIKSYVVSAKNKSELDRQKEVLGRDKTGVFTGLCAINPVNGERIPIWITDFVLSTVGTGAVMGVPGHDVRDFEFATQFKLPIRRVVVGEDGDSSEVKEKSQVQDTAGKMVNSDFLDGMEIMEAKDKIMAYLEEKEMGKKETRYHLRDWIFSRQHYWGEPIPMVYCEDCGWVPVPEEQLPVKLPEVDHYEPTDTGESPLATITDWVNTTCPKCGKPAKRETDTMPNWAGSDWYFVRYTDPHNTQKIADFGKMKKWLPVDVYIGGDEHNTLHLLYSRFIYQVLYDLGIVPTPEPYDKRVSHGVILDRNNQRMSKSRGNVIVPGEFVEKVGADVTRTYLMFMGPFDATMAWNDNSLMGVKRFINRFYEYFADNKDKFANEDSKDVSIAINKLVKFATDSLEKFQFNTVIAKVMELLNQLEKGDDSEISKDSALKIVKIMAPFAPFMSDELWKILGQSDSIHVQDWPVYDEKLIESEGVEVPVVINGKIRGKLILAKEEEESSVISKIKADSTYDPYVPNGKYKKLIYVPGRIVNIVV